jgi:hypothetical protein
MQMDFVNMQDQVGSLTIKDLGQLVSDQTVPPTPDVNACCARHSHCCDDEEQHPSEHRKDVHASLPKITSRPI